MHDNANCPIDNGTVPTSGLVLDVDTESFKVHLRQRFRNPDDLLFTTAQGNFQRLDQGHVFLGHGYWPFIEEFDASGNIIMTVQFGAFPGNLSRTSSAFPGTLSYRAFRSDWIGCPKTAPAITADMENGGVAVYMSWNGATEYDTWNVYGGEAVGNLTRVTSVSRAGFETRVVIGSTKYVQVEAVTVGSNKTALCHQEGSRSEVFSV